ncbi:MAG: aminoglycoside phosphotransferase family protein [Pseudomonadota bacterium]
MFGGRTNRVWKVLGDEGDKVLKLYRSALQNPLFRNDARLEARCLEALDAKGFVPRLRAAGQYKLDQWVLYDHAPGTPWTQGSKAVAKLLRHLHDMRVQIQAPPGCNGSSDLARHAQHILDLCGSDARAQITAARPRTTVPCAADTCLIHGDPVAGNILVSDTGLTLIDWQCPAIGDPCEDIALFLSPAMQHLYRGHPLNMAEEQEFLSGYGMPDRIARYQALRPWFAWRMAAYCLWRIENGSADYKSGLALELATL